MHWSDLRQIECHGAGPLSAAASLQKLPLWLVQTLKWISERMLRISAWPGYLSDRVTGLVGALQHDFIVPVTTKEDESLDARDMQRWGLRVSKHISLCNKEPLFLHVLLTFVFFILMFQWKQRQHCRNIVSASSCHFGHLFVSPLVSQAARLHNARL